MRWIAGGLLVLATGIGGCLTSSFDVGGGLDDGGTDTSSSDAADSTSEAPLDTTSVDTALDAAADSMVDAPLETADTAPVCVDDSGCGPAQYCARCGAAPGQCRARPISPPGLAPVCGCDGITYWNVGLAVARHVDVVSEGPCTKGGLSCASTSSEPCPLGTECVEAAPSASACGVEGRCWRISTGSTSPDCSMGAGAKVRKCGDGACTTTCAAIVAGQRYYPGDGC